ncbi:hypothetical protein, partial [Gilvimarinus sp. 1_MG-2023]|uniref:hypothetical protein n=1 Tax=Gilvimarinus sp. 1_MG-2023 TaxID=3062638 RepID=UPI0026E41E6C
TTCCSNFSKKRIGQHKPTWPLNKKTRHYSVRMVVGTPYALRVSLGKYLIYGTCYGLFQADHIT